MISVDTVYQRVLALANKEQRGYITPQEFNLLANQAQMEIFEQYFYDESLQDKNLKNSTEMSNIDENIDEKISIFKRTEDIHFSNKTGLYALPLEMYRLGMVMYPYTNSDTGEYGVIEVEQVTEEEITYLLGPGFGSNYTRPTDAYPVFVRRAYRAIAVFPIIMDPLAANIIVKPAKVRWGYVVVNGKALYDSGSSINFDIHEADVTELVYKILSLAGIVIAKPGLGTYGDQQITAQKTQEKQ
jgi:hypothetical protein